MIQVNYMKPFYTKLTARKLRLVFAYQYFSVVKDNELYYFVPIEGKEMIVNLDTMQIENLAEVFVFQKGNRFLRLPLYQLMLMSNIQEHLLPMLEEVIAKANDVPQQQPAPPPAVDEPSAFEQELTKRNYDYLIDCALDSNDEAAFHKLVDAKKQLEVQPS